MHRDRRHPPPEAAYDSTILYAFGFCVVIAVFVVGFALLLWWINGVHDGVRLLHSYHPSFDSPCSPCPGQCVTDADCPTIYVVSSASITPECRYEVCRYAIDPGFSGIAFGGLAHHLCREAVLEASRACLSIYAIPLGDLAGECEAYFPCTTLSDDAFVTRRFALDNKADELYNT